MAVGGTVDGDHARILRHFNEALTAAKLPYAAMLAKMEELDQRARGQGLTWYFNDRSLVAFGIQFAETCARLECAVAGIGVERFRVKHGRWPTTLDEVVAAKLLDSVPADVFFGKPLHYRNTSDGVVVFSVGPDGICAGDALEAGGKTGAGPPRLEFRLWDENKRRQAAAK